MDPRLSYCPACNRRVEEFRPGGSRGGRPRARCPNCGALERHRFLSLLLDGLAPAIMETGRVLDIAPSRYVTDRMERIGPARYVTMDFDPDADARTVGVQASITELPFRDGSFDLIVCYHVLEHVPDDRRAMQELARALSPGGLAVVQVPFRPGRPTDEDPDAPVDERIRRFGQADHVRWYGDDLEERLAAAGLVGARVQVRDVLSETAARAIAVPLDGVVWLLRSATSGGPADVRVARGFRLRALDDLLVLAEERSIEAERLSDRLARAEKLAAEDRRRYERLRHHPAIDFAATVTRPIRKLRAPRRPSG